VFEENDVEGCGEDTGACDELGAFVDDVKRLIEPVGLELAPTSIEDAILVIVADEIAPLVV
jgi:hypothetical protein